MREELLLEAGRRRKSPRPDGCLKPRRASRKSLEEPLERKDSERKESAGSGKTVRRQVKSVSRVAQEDQPKAGKKAAGSVGGFAGCNLAAGEPQRPGVSRVTR